VKFLGAFTLAFVAAGTLCADLEKVRAEPNLEKRSRYALENADQALRQARDAYAKGEMEQAENLVAEVLQSVELAQISLKNTGKDPRRSPKHFKKAEIETRDLLRKLASFEQELSVADRHILEKVKPRIQQVQEELLLGVMGKRK